MTPNELIKKELESSNKIFGYLKNNILYMKSFDSIELGWTLCTIGLAFIGIALDFESKKLMVNFFWIFGFMYIIGLILYFSMRRLLVYDINRKVIYSYTFIFGLTLHKSDEISTDSLVELALVNNLGSQANSDFTNKISALTNNGQLIDITFAREKHLDINTRRCKLLAQCIGIPYKVFDHPWHLKITKDDNNNYRLYKLSQDEVKEMVGINKLPQTVYYGTIAIFIIFLIYIYFTYLK